MILLVFQLQASLALLTWIHSLDKSYSRLFISSYIDANYRNQWKVVGINSMRNMHLSSAYGWVINFNSIHRSQIQTNSPSHHRTKGVSHKLTHHYNSQWCQAYPVTTVHRQTYLLVTTLAMCTCNFDLSCSWIVSNNNNNSRYYNGFLYGHMR